MKTVYCKKAFHQFKVGDKLVLHDGNADDLIEKGFVTATKPKAKSKPKVKKDVSKDK